MHTRQGCAAKCAHLLVEIKLTGTLEQSILTAREESSQVGIHPRPDLAIQLSRLQLYAEEQHKHSVDQGPAGGSLSNTNAPRMQPGELETGREGQSARHTTGRCFGF